MFTLANPGTSAPPAGSIFGNLGANTSSSTGSGPSLFSNANTSNAPSSSAPSTGGLFGSTSANTQPAQAGGLFGAAQSKPAAGPIFGTASASTSAPTSSLFAPASTGPPAGSTLFGTASTGPSSQPNNTAFAGSVQQRADGSGQAAYFNSLLEKNKKRAREEQSRGPGEMPSLQLGLGDISKRVRELGGIQSHTKREGGADSRAHYLLAASGVNPGSTLRDLNSFSETSSAAAPARPGQDFEPDTYKYVGQLQERTTQKMIKDGLERVNKAFDAFVEEQVSIDWEQQRQRVYQHFGLTPRGTALNDSVNGSFGRSSRRLPEGRPQKASGMGRSIFSQSALQKSVIGTPDRDAPLFGKSNDQNGNAAELQDDRFLREKQAKFAAKIQDMNEARLQDISYPIFGEFMSVESQALGGSPGQIMDAYRALVEIVQEDNNPRGLKPRQFASDYLDDALNSAKSISMRKRIVDGSRHALEKQFYSQLESFVAKNPKEASIGGMPTVINKVRAYVRIRHARKDLVADNVALQTLPLGEGGEDYPWALLFFLLRAGFVKEAMQYVRDNQNTFRTIDRNFITYIGSYYSDDDQRLPRAQSEKINNDFMQKSRLSQAGSNDPYRMACYKVIGRCDLSRRSLDDVSRGVEDWLWLQFALAREGNRAEEFAGDVFGLAEVQETIKDVGQRYFAKGSEGTGGAGTFFYLQILAGLFENAVSYLYQHSYVSAVHIAASLAYYGLLRVSDFTVSENELLTYTTREQPQISFGRMIGYYTRDFRTADAIAATDYLSLICLNSDLPGTVGSQQVELCHEAVRELILETREFVALLGDIRPQTGERIPGAVELRLPLLKLAGTDDFLRNITLQAAAVADDAGRTSDAVVLFHLAEDYDSVVTILNRAASEVLGADENFTSAGVPQVLPGEQPKEGQEDEFTSMSLTSIDSPVALMKKIIPLYNANAMYYQRIRSQNRNIMGTLAQVAHVRDAVLQKQWSQTLNLAADTGLLPLHARDNVSVVRSCSNNVTTSPPPIKRVVGPLLLWVLIAISHERQPLISGGGFQTPEAEMKKRELAILTKDLMIFLGLVRLRMPKSIWDELDVYNGELGPEWGQT